jgi:DNA polymerase-3 subunit gamma/tau
MKKRIFFIGLAAATLIGCRGNGGGLRRDQAQYETVQEGTASGNATALNPDPAQPALAMTGTNADTTSAFTLPNTIPPAAPAPGAPGTLAATMPAPDAPRSTPLASPAPRPRVVERAPEPASPEPAPSAEDEKRQEQPTQPAESEAEGDGDNEPAPAPPTNTNQ